MKAIILTADGVEDSEFFYPYYRLKEEGIDVDVAAPDTGTFTGKHGYEMEANLSFADVRADDYDLLILPGGKAPETVRLDGDALSVTCKLVQADKVIAAICHGVQILISAKAVAGKKGTCWAGIRDDFKSAGGDYTDEEVVVDGSLITSRWPGDLPAFSREILKAIRAAAQV